MTTTCPKCSKEGQETKQSAVDFQTDNKAKKANWFTCMTKECEVGYFCEDQIINISELKDRLWYKDAGEDVYICYCGKITRKDIAEAVAKGAIIMNDVVKLMDKDFDCNCSTNNPTGKCCCNAFLHEIDIALNDQKND